MNSQTGHIGLSVQASKGTFKDPNFFVKYSDDSIGVEPTNETADMMIGGGRDIEEVYPGGYSVTGGLNFDTKPDFVGLAFLAVLGADTNTNVAVGVEQHVIKPSNNLPYLSGQKKVSDTYDVFNYTDLKVNDLTISCEAGGQMTAELNVLGLDEESDATPLAPSYELSETFMWHSGTIQLEGTTICPIDISLEINNNIDDSDYRICPDAGRGLYSLNEGSREINAEMTIRPEDSSLYKKANYGEAAATSMTKKIYTGSLNYKFVSVNPIVDGGTDYYELDINIPKAYFQPFKIEPSNDDEIEHGLQLLAGKPDDGSDIITVTVQNAIADYTV